VRVLDSPSAALVPAEIEPVERLGEPLDHVPTGQPPERIVSPTSWTHPVSRRRGRLKPGDEHDTVNGIEALCSTAVEAALEVEDGSLQ
jgi:hypothetical protein